LGYPVSSDSASTPAVNAADAVAAVPSE
jgi:hypothetical protein